MPWGISHKHKFIFIHIPKTAGTTICSSWDGSLLKQICKQHGVLGGTHKTALQLKNMYPKEWGEYYKFTVVRNPYDRFVSKFFFKQLHPRQDFSLGWSDKEGEGLLPQLYWITDREQIFKPTSPYDRVDLHYGNIMVDKICRYESLEADLREVFAKLGVEVDPKVFPHFRQTRLDGTYQRYFTKEFKAIVTYMYRDDLARLDYGWIGHEPTNREVPEAVIDETYIRKDNPESWMWGE